MKKKLILLYLAYIRFFARLQLKKINPYVIGVGGSSGKSSTTEIISICLSQKFKIRQSKGKNSETGIPLDILGIEIKEYSFYSWAKILFLAPIKLLKNNEKYEVYVVEMGIDSPLPPKNMEFLLKIIRPNLAVVTNIDIEHSEAFDDLVKSEIESERKKEILQLITKEEGLLLKSITESGRSIVNLDDSNIKKLLPLKSKMTTISAKDKNSDLFISRIEVNLESFEMNMEFLGEKYTLRVKRPLPKYFAYSFALSISTSFSFGISIAESIRVIEENFTLPPGRFSVFSGIKNTILIDSSYNSSLSAAKGALETVFSIGNNRRKLGILGDMRELGTLSKTQHESLAKTILKTLDLVVIIGPQMEKYVAPILKDNNFKFFWFANYSSSKDEILKLINERDIILVKSSQNTLFLERFVELLLENKNDKEQLCRRGKFWDKLRKITP